MVFTDIMYPYKHSLMLDENRLLAGGYYRKNRLQVQSPCEMYEELDAKEGEFDRFLEKAVKDPVFTRKVAWVLRHVGISSDENIMGSTRH